MSQAPQRDEFPTLSFAESLGVIYFFALAYSTCLTLFSRWRFGPNAFGLYALVSPVIFVLGMCLFHDLAIGVMALAWCVMLIVHRVNTFREAVAGIRLHSEFAGYPWIARWYGSEKLARMHEPALWLLAGLVLVIASPFLMLFVWGGAAALMVRTVMEDLAHENRVRNLLDAEIEQEILLDEWNQRRGDPWA